MAVLLSLAAALAYGMSDFVGGLVSRRTSAWPVAVVGGLSSALCASAVALVVPGSPRAVDFGWAVLAGIAVGCGVAFLYRGFAAGQISIVAPVSAVGAALVPVAVGVATGERPGLLVWLGILAAGPAIWLVSAAGELDEHGSVRAGLLDGVLAGAGFGVLFAAIGQVPHSSGLWPLAASQAISVPTIIALATALGASWRPGEPATWWALASGPFGSSASVLFLLATQHGYLTVAGVLTSLYPALTVVLAVLVLHERLTRTQGLGLLLCAVTVGLVAGG
ncbi:DMT family transporter [Nocardioides mangrovicus]|uniref:DMT family transporter n=1 Tax=Nocardioides mangrovicus TaxID=2478913 RepID=A0A3L8P468_9ACTN|nr:DMT family transporter [Nocardioides mangrovicus]